MSQEEGWGNGAQACRALGLARSSYYRVGKESVESRRVRKETLELSEKHPRYGYRRITALLRREGFEVNPKRVARIRREEGLKVSKKQRRMKRLGLSTAQRQRAERPRQVWSWDFVADQTENGSNFRILTLIDEHTRECLALHAGCLPRNVETEADHLREAPDRDANVAIYQPDEMQAILDALPDKWIPFAAIGAFAGCRGAEIHRLDWKDIDLEERHITVESSKSKTGKRRVVPISDNLLAYLAPYAQESGWVCPHYSHDSTLAQEFGKAWDAAGIAVKKINNGFRHSYASYRIEEVKSLPQVAWEMNTSERKLRDNYLELVSAKKLAKWKSIFPATSRPEKRG